MARVRAFHDRLTLFVDFAFSASLPVQPESQPWSLQFLIVQCATVIAAGDHRQFLLEFETSSLESYSPYRDRFLHRANVGGGLPFSSQVYLSAAVWRLVMATQPLSPLALKLQLEQKPNETIVHCKGKITAAHRSP